jgi:hypothetical protein
MARPIRSSNAGRPRSRQLAARKRIEQTTKEQVDEAIRAQSGVADVDEIADKHKREVIRQGKLIEKLMSQDGWKDVVQPILDEMICSVIGRKTNGRWQAGHFIRSRKDESGRFYTGYSTGLIEFNNRLQDIIRKKKHYLEEEKRRKIMEKQGMIDPMLEDQ